MWRALGVTVGFVLLAGIIAALTGDLPATANAPPETRGPSTASFGFALAAGAVALAATLLMSRPRRRFR